MEFNLLHIFTLFSIALIGSHAVTPEVYWKSMLPNSPMPKSVKNLLYTTTDWDDEKKTFLGVGNGGLGLITGKPGVQQTNVGGGVGVGVGVGIGGVTVNTGTPGRGTYVGVGNGGVGVYTGEPGRRTDVGLGNGGVGVHTGIFPGQGTGVGVGNGGVGVHTGTFPGQRTDVGIGNGGVGVHTGTFPGQRTDVGVGNGGIGVHTGINGRPVYVGVHPGQNPFNYIYAASADQLKDNPNVALFFLEKDLRQGTEMNLHFTKNDQKVMFLPRKIADSIPFLSNKLPQIYNEFSVKPDTMEAETMKQTLNECENKGMEGEEKYCATSLESMIDFTTSKLGKNVRAISTEVNAKESTPLQKYDIEAAKQLVANKTVVCHKQNYAYAVFYCHKTSKTRAYSVSLAGADGTKVKAVSICHTDTTKWNPKHLAFQVLKVKPGSVPICHFLPEDHLVWVPY